MEIVGFIEFSFQSELFNIIYTRAHAENIRFRRGFN